jgi:catechol 2,3-dioxygenase-like lactoylglutathione lyase family enzyme
MRLNRAMLYVKDMPRMAAFYGDVLGLEPIDATRLDTYIEFDAGNATFALHAIPRQTASQIEITSPPKPRENNPVKLIFEVDDVSAESERLVSLGVTILQRPWGTFDGIDPEGNVFQIYSATTR